jgi:hypothetical protein
MIEHCRNHVSCRWSEIVNGAENGWFTGDTVEEKILSCFDGLEPRDREWHWVAPGLVKNGHESRWGWTLCYEHYHGLAQSFLLRELFNDPSLAD